jgi:hypothetical protein
MVTVLEEYIVEDQRSVVLFYCGQKGSTQRIFIKKCFLFTMGSIYRVKQFTTESRICHLGGKGFADDEEDETEVRKCLRQQSKRLLCCRFRRTGKAVGQVYQSWWRICREINVFSQVRISHVLRFISICDLFTDSPSQFAFAP